MGGPRHEHAVPGPGQTAGGVGYGRERGIPRPEGGGAGGGGRFALGWARGVEDEPGGPEPGSAGRAGHWAPAVVWPWAGPMPPRPPLPTLPLPVGTAKANAAVNDGLFAGSVPPPPQPPAPRNGHQAPRAAPSPPSSLQARHATCTPGAHAHAQAYALPMPCPCPAQAQAHAQADAQADALPSPCPHATASSPLLPLPHMWPSRKWPSGRLIMASSGLSISPSLSL